MSQKKAKQARAQARRGQPIDPGVSDALLAMRLDNTLMDGLRLGGRALGMVARRPFAPLRVLLGSLAVWLPAAALVANLMAAVLAGGAVQHESALAFGFAVSFWLLAPVMAAAAVEAAFFMSQGGRVRWRVVLASFGCEKGIAWLVGGSLVSGLGVQAISVWVDRAVVDPGHVAGVLLAMAGLGLFARVVLFLATTHLWAGEPGGLRAIGWAARSFPRVVIAWAGAMFVMLAAFIVMLGVLLGLAWVVLLGGQAGSGAQVALSILLLWPVVLVAMAGLVVMEGRVMLELHALAMAGPGKPSPGEVDA